MKNMKNTLKIIALYENKLRKLFFLFRFLKRILLLTTIDNFF